MIAAWYFTRCIGANPKHALTFLRILECLQSRSEAARTIAVEQVMRVDDWMQLYALPHVLAATPAIESQEALDTYYSRLTEGRESAELLLELIDSAVQRDARACIEAFRRFAQWPRRAPAARSPLPYIDLREFGDESIALAAFRAGVARLPEIREDFKRAGKEAMALVETALTHDLGRMAFVEAIRVAYLTGLRSRDALLELIEQHPDPLSEPDLAETLVWLRFCQTTDDAEHIVLALVQESIALLEYRRLMRIRRRDAAQLPAFSALSSISRRGLERVVLWQLVLWSTAAGVHPEAASRALAKFWIAPQQRKGIVTIGHPGDATLRAEWVREIVQPFLKQKGIALEARAPRDAAFEPNEAWWTVASPWLLSVSGQEYQKHRYVRQSALNLLRLFGSASIATRLLLGQQAAAEAMPGLAALVVHAYDVMEGFDLSLGVSRMSDMMSDVPKELQVLALFTHRQIAVVSAGEAGVTPVHFVQLLRREPNSEDEVIFTREVLPSALVSFVTDAIPLAVSGSGSSEWIGLVPLLYAFVDRARPKVRLKGQLLVRFLSEVDLPLDDWIATAERNRTYWNQKPQRLLLPRESTAGDWYRPEWPEPSEKHHTVPAVRAIQRFAASFNNDGLPDDVIKAWREEFSNFIAQMSNRPDTFVRLRLMEVLFDPAVTASREIRDAIFLLLAEHATPFDVECLARGLFPNEPALPRDGELRKIFVSFAIREAEAIDLYENTEASDPRLIMRWRQRSETFRIALRRAAFLARTNGQFERLQEHLAELLSRNDERRTPDAYRTTLELSNEREVEMPPPLPGIARQIRSISRDPNRMTATLLYEEFDFDAATVRNLLYAKGDTSQSLVGLDRVKLLGVVVDEDRKHITIDCGLPEFLRTDRTVEVRTGKLVAVDASRRNGAWEVDRLVPLAPRRDLSPALLRIRRFGKMHLPEIYLGRSLLDTEPNAEGYINWNYWLPDIRRAYQLGAMPEHTALAERLATGEWRPVLRDLWELIAGIGTKGEAVLVSVTDNGYVLSPDIGFLIAVARKDLDTATASRIEALINHVEDPRGLLLPVELKLDIAGHVVLTLADKGSNDVNVRWRRLFTDGETLTARRESGGYVCVLDQPIEGFPRVVNVNFGDEPQSDAEIDFTVDDIESAWDPWRNTVRGTVAHFSELKVVPHRRFQFVDELLKIGPGRSRRRVFGSRANASDRGDVICYTEEGVPVEVRAESLTFAWLKGQSFVERSVGREVQVTYLGRSQPVSVAVAHEDVPRAVLDAGVADGIIARAPRPKEKTTQYVIWWKCENSVEESEVSIEGPPPFVGTPVRAVVGDDAVQLTVFPRRIKADALWRQVKGDIADNALFLANARIDGTERAVIERRPGEFLLVPAVGRVRHLARWNRAQAKFIEGFTGREPVTVQPLGTLNRKRAMVVAAGKDVRHVVWGDTFHSGGNVMVSDVQLAVTRTNDQQYILTRTFQLADRRVDVPDRPDDSLHYQQLLDAYFEPGADRVLSVRVRPPNTVFLASGLRVPDPKSGRWTSEILFAPGQATWVAAARYGGGRARAILLAARPGERFYASSRDVPALTLAQYFELLDSEPGEEIALDQALYYVGEVPDSPGLHRFEWDYGWTLIVHEDDLRFGTRSFSTLEDLIFHGDAVRKVTFEVEQASDDDDGGESEPLPPHYRLILNDLSIDYSDATLIFLQRRRHQIVHLLRLKPRLSRGEIADVEISSVVGMNDESADPWKGFERTRAVLSPQSYTAVMQRLRTAQEGEPWNDPAVYGRLDEEVFRQNLGETVQFDLVELTMNESHPHRLRSGELVFLAAGRGEPVRNDYALKLTEASGVHRHDVGKDARELVVLRRRFSVREEVLPRLLRRDEAALDGHLFLVRLDIAPKKKDIVASLWSDRSDMPARKATVLLPLIEQTFVLATVIAANQLLVEVEYSPGIFVSIDVEQIEFTSTDLLDELRQGTVIRIEKGSSKIFNVSRAAFSDERYLGQLTRAVVVLPKNELFKPETRAPWQRGDASWSRGIRFPIGGMPDVQAVAASYNVLTNKWAAPSAAQFRAFMGRPHPKIAVAGRDQSGDVRIEPARGNVYSGAVAVDEETLVPSYEPDEFAGKPWKEPLSWPFLSFADASARSIAGRLSRTWRYHDDETCVWIGEDEAKFPKAGPHNGRTGPLMFESRGDDLYLRYSADQLEHYGHPMRELVNYLGDDGRNDWFVVAAVTPSSMWVEIAPGRVAELPFAQIIHAVAPTASLASLAWELFAPGDVVELKLASTNPKKPDRVSIVQWIPSIRGAAGDATMILPVDGHDLSEGVLRLGAGAFRMNYPWLGQRHPRAVAIDRRNRAIALRDHHLEPGVTALLMLGDDGRLRLAGFPGREVAPSNSGWDADPLATWLSRISAAKELLDIVGGTIPVTVQDVTARTIYFSRARQKNSSILPDGRMTVAHVLGALKGNRMLLRSGSALFVGRTDSAVSGIPATLASAVADDLRERRVPVWIRGDGGMEVSRYGIADERTSVIRASAVAVAADGVASGIACRSLATQALYWMPSTEIAWTRLSAEEIRAIYLDAEFSFGALLIRNDRGRDLLSITRNPDAVGELRDLHVDQELSVHVLLKRQSASASERNYLVATLGSRIVLSCRREDVDEDARDLAGDLRVEVVRRFMSHPPVVAVTPVGKRRPQLDMPSWMLTDAVLTSEPRDMIRNTLTWAAAESVTPRREFKGAPDWLLDQAVCEAWGCLRSPKPFDMKLGMKIAESWAAASADRAEVELSHALMCIVLLLRGADWYRRMNRRPELAAEFERDWSRLAVDLIGQVASRAVRSLHSEVLATRWLKATSTDEEDRLHALRTTFKGPLDANDVNAVRRFYRFAELTDWATQKPTRRLIADACRRVTGSAERDDRFHTQAGILDRIIRIGDASAVMNRDNRKLHHGYLAQIEWMIGQLIANKLDITLLMPIDVAEVRSSK